MKVSVSKGNFGGEIKAIASKSFAHRLLICAAFSDKSTSVECSTISEDIIATIRCLNALGAKIERIGNNFIVQPIDKNNIPIKPELDCGESGSTLRFMLPVTCALGIDAEFIMRGRLAQRPLSPLYEELQSAGIDLSEQGTSPLSISGQLNRNSFKIRADVSSQFISGLLMALPIIGGGKVQLEGKVESASYINITVECMKLFGVDIVFEDNTYSVLGQYISSSETVVEGDWSNAAFWLCAGAVGNKSITMTGLNMNSVQGDRKIVDIIKMFGSDIMVTDSSITVNPSKLSGCEIDASDIPDLVPIITVLAAKAEGTTRIYNAARLRLKESDRIESVYNVMSTVGVDIITQPDGLIINGGKQLTGGSVDSWNDHRIAMTSAIASLLTSNSVIIDTAQSVNKSYPDFYKDFVRLGGQVETEE